VIYLLIRVNCCHSVWRRCNCPRTKRSAQSIPLSVIVADDHRAPRWTPAQLLADDGGTHAGCCESCFSNCCYTGLYGHAWFFFMAYSIVCITDFAVTVSSTHCNFVERADIGMTWILGTLIFFVYDAGMTSGSGSGSGSGTGPGVGSGSSPGSRVVRMTWIVLLFSWSFSLVRLTTQTGECVSSTPSDENAWEEHFDTYFAWAESSVITLVCLALLWEVQRRVSDREHRIATAKAERLQFNQQHPDRVRPAIDPSDYRYHSTPVFVIPRCNYPLHLHTTAFILFFVHAGLVLVDAFFSKVFCGSVDIVAEYAAFTALLWYLFWNSFVVILEESPVFLH
jgi:uncharacterized membrane protein